MLPATTHDLVGREGDLQTLSGLVGSERLVTVVGPGGVGKTALVRALAARLGAGPVTELPTAYFVPLADVDDDAAVRSVVARHLGLQDSGDRRLDDLLGAGDALVVLDGCEHVVDGAAAVAADLLEVPGLRLVATSREPLSVVGEHVFGLSPLDVPDVDDVYDADAVTANPAVRLFLRRAAAAGATPVPADQHSDLVRLVRALDGLPLALELAAGRSRCRSTRWPSGWTTAPISCGRPPGACRSGIAARWRWSTGPTACSTTTNAGSSSRCPWRRVVPTCAPWSPWASRPGSCRT